MTITKKDAILYKPKIEDLVAPNFRLIVRPEQKPPTERKEMLPEDEEGMVLGSNGLYTPVTTHNDDAWKDRQITLMQNSGIVIKIGRTCGKTFDDGTFEVNVGDRVYFKRYIGEDFECTDGNIYKVIKDDDIELIERKYK